MKKIILFCLLLSSFTAFSLPPQYKFLVQIKDSTYIPDSVSINVDSTLYLHFPSSSLTSFFSNYDVYNFYQQFPTARTPLLQEAYLISTTDSTLDSLLWSFNSVGFGIIARQFEPILLNPPNDYNILSGFSPPTHLDLINAQGAWDITQGISYVLIGIIDEGFALGHDDLVNKIFDHRGTNKPLKAHGTWVSGAACAETNNGIGISSIGFNCGLYLSSNYYFTSSALNNEMLILSQQPRVKVLNASWLNTCVYDAFGQAVYDEIYENGVTVVAAAGNGPDLESCGSGHDYAYPASYNHVISVTSVAHENNPGPGVTLGIKDRHDYDIVGHYQTHTHNDKVDICAPGYKILTTQQNNGYTEGWGTSLASPIVAGVCGLLYSINPCFTPDDIESIIKTTAVDIYSISENVPYTGQLGAGRIDAEAAVTKAAGLSATTITDPNLIWTETQCIAGTLTIVSGAKLTIQSNVYIKAGVKIIVEPGGRLVIDGGHLTGYCNATEQPQTWEGIEVWGTPWLDQLSPYTNHGVIEVKNGSIIENAYNAIYTGESGSSAHNGGIAFISNSSFFNNRYSLNIPDYGSVTGFQNKSYIASTLFECKAALFNSGSGPLGVNHHVAIVGTYGVGIYGCEFKNSLGSGAFADNHRGNGIQCINGSFIADRSDDPYTSSLPCNINDLDRNLFQGLSVGINTYDFAGGQSGKTTYMLEGDFVNCSMGINMNSEGVKKVYNNTMTWGGDELIVDDISLLPNQAINGIRSENYWDVNIGDNYLELQSDYYTYRQFQGITVIGSGPTGQNFVYKNEINCLTTLPLLYFGLGRGIRGNYFTGNNSTLNVECNTYTNLNYDWDISGTFQSQGNSGSHSNIFSSYNSSTTINIEANSLTQAFNVYAGSPYPSTFVISGSSAPLVTPLPPGILRTCPASDPCVIRDFSGDPEGGGDLTVKPQNTVVNDIYEAIKDGKYSYAAKEIETLGFNPNLSDEYVFLSIYYLVKSEGRTFSALTEIEKHELSLIACNNTKAGRHAKTVLESFTDYAFPCRYSFIEIRGDDEELNTNSVSDELSLRILPNPAATTFKVEFQLSGQSGILSIINANGSILTSLPIQQNTPALFDCSTWLPGVYFVRIVDEFGKQGVEKLIIVK